MMEAWVSLKRLQRYMNLDSVCWTQYYTTSELTGTTHFTVSLSVRIPLVCNLVAFTVESGLIY